MPTNGIDQLAELGLSPSDIEFAAFSHMHLDHVGAANAFTESTILIQRPEYQAAFVDFEHFEIFDPSLHKDLGQADLLILDGDHDVFGDGRVRILSAPGHTPGHQVLWLDLDETGPLVLSGDLYHFQLSRRERRTPLANFDREQTLASMDKIEHVIEQTGATLWRVLCWRRWSGFR